MSDISKIWIYEREFEPDSILWRYLDRIRKKQELTSDAAVRAIQMACERITFLSITTTIEDQIEIAAELLSLVHKKFAIADDLMEPANKMMEKALRLATPKVTPHEKH